MRRETDEKRGKEQKCSTAIVACVSLVSAAPASLIIMFKPLAALLNAQQHTKKTVHQSIK